MIEYLGNKKNIIYKQAAVLPFRIIENRLQFLLITSRKAGNWIIPKGLFEEGLSPSELAVKEAYEEAGIVGTISAISLGEYRYKKWNGICQVQVFSMLVTSLLDEWPEDDFRFRQWFEAEKARDVIRNSELKDILNEFISEQKKVNFI
jgi:8-oxo-dGTP pyrophosphatase MutT (NUDIX family)